MLHRLKCKVGSLGAEARILRKFEQHERKIARKIRARGEFPIDAEYRRNDIHQHRVHGVRPEARHSGLAYVFLKGKHPYSRVEQKCYEKPNFDEVLRIAERFAEERHKEGDIKQRFAEWTQS